MTIKMRVILPRKVVFDMKKLSRAIENALDGSAKAVKVDFDVTTQTWKGRPEFKIDSEPGKRIIYTDSDVYRFVSRGTRVRYATMSADFRPKTRTRFIGSSIGRGGVVRISKLHPRPGIKAREFEQEIGEKWRDLFPKTMQRAIDAEL